MENLDNNVTLMNIANNTSTIATKLDSNFIPANMHISVKLDGTGDFNNLTDALNYLIGKYSNGTVYIELDKGTFNVSELTINTRDFNIPWIWIVGDSPSTTILSNPIPDTIGINVYNDCSKIYFKNLTIKGNDNSNLNSNFKPAIWVDYGRIRFFQCDFNTYSAGVYGLNSNVVFSEGSTYNFTNLGHQPVSMVLGSVASFNSSTLNINNVLNCFYSAEGSVISLRECSVNVKNCSGTRVLLYNGGTVCGFS